MTSTTIRTITNPLGKPSSICRLFGAILSSLLFVGVSYADIFHPQGLNPGDKYRIAFVSAATRDATSTNISDYNSFVNSAANAGGTLTAPLGTTWTAFASTSSVTARDNTSTNPNIQTGVPIFLVNGTTQIATNNADLWDGTLAALLRLDESGNDQSNVFVWTGSNADGTASIFLGQPSGIAGATPFTDSNWMKFGTLGSTNPEHFYGISAQLTAVPEPAGLVCAAFAALGLFAMRRARRVSRAP